MTELNNVTAAAALMIAQGKINIMKSALDFIADIATEEHSYSRVGTGAEVALRHIIRKAEDALRIVKEEA